MKILSIECSATPASCAIIEDGKILGVIDLDSEKYANYEAEDVKFLEELAIIISKVIK